MRIFERNANMPSIDSSEVSVEGLSPAFSASIALSFIFVIFICFYCFYQRSRKKSLTDDEDQSSDSTGEELRSINNKKNSEAPAEERTRKMSHWNKLTSFFQGTSATEELNFRIQSNESLPRAGNADSSALCNKSAMGNVRTSYVQPQSKEGSSNAPAAPAKRRKSFIPESFKLPFDPWLLTEESSSPPHGANYVGRLEFSVSYTFETMTLVLKILRAADLPAMDLSGFSDPFVKCCLLPDRKRKLETKIRRKTLNPTWSETLFFEGLSYDKIQQRVLYMQVMDWDRFSRNDPIGEVCIPLHQADLTDSQPQWEYLTPCKGSNKRGELLVSLCYQPVDGTIEVGIKQAKNLKPMDIGGSSVVRAVLAEKTVKAISASIPTKTNIVDPYVKIWLLVKGKRMEKRKTATVKCCLDPKFDETFTFSSPMETLRETQLQISVMDRDVIGRNEVIGKIYLGTKSNALEKRHWKEMLTKAKQPVEQWHILKV